MLAEKSKPIDLQQYQMTSLSLRSSHKWSPRDKCKFGKIHYFIHQCDDLTCFQISQIRTNHLHSGTPPSNFWSVFHLFFFSAISDGLELVSAGWTRVLKQRYEIAVAETWHAYIGDLPPRASSFCIFGLVFLEVETTLSFPFRSTSLESFSVFGSRWRRLWTLPLATLVLGFWEFSFATQWQFHFGSFSPWNTAC